MHKYYKITVIICIFNEKESILAALKSLKKNEIYYNTEIILVDDCSIDRMTLKILARLNKFTNIQIIKSENNLGLSNSRNLGFKNASTDIIIPLDADDEFPAKTLDLIYKTFTDNSAIDFIVGNYYLNNVERNEIKLISCSDIATNGIIEAKKLSINWKLLGTSPCKKRVWEKVGGYNLEFSYSVQDVDFWIRVLQQGFLGMHLDYPIYIWNRSENGMNLNFDRFDMIKILEQHEDFYLSSWSKKELYNKIFEGFYPYKNSKKIISLGRRYFNHLKFVNKLRTLYMFYKWKLQ